ncbi:efflux RND transporter periplasmic adaptor subunit [Geomesophilobacter sediminis]|uniref:Efflux RND transporter periplasmic adaptor subunit n=1 Tax=Geomesophilobacter sediminis TaxID=2798584 RepID=A0A8J7LZ26_9BACT|nr:efflux RND transporter periplasmic adaptor subunit [Geomesophilobacter sediminis]MBJ6725791.1 efflux RND transporter periplasmic adaptor subunit [Geomesophilobacter sediminis]
MFLDRKKLLGPKCVLTTGAAALIAGALLFALKSGKPAAQRPGADNQAVSVAVAKVDVEDLNDEVNLTADLKPNQEVEVMAKVAGYVKAIYVDIGSQVHKGQLLAELEVPELADDLTRAKAALKRTEAEAERAKSELNRAQSAYNIARLSYSRLSNVASQRPGLVAQQELDDVKSRELAAEAQVASAQSSLAAAHEQIQENQAALAKIRTIIDYSRVTAPFDGVVTKRYADTGSMIQAGTASQTQAMPVVRLSQLNLLRITVPVPEPDVPVVRVGGDVQVNVPTVKRLFPGKVARFADKVNESTRTMNTEIDVPNDGHLLVPGMFAEVKLSLGRRRGVLTVPVAAVDVAKEKDAAGGAGNGSAAERVGTVLVVSPDNHLRLQQVRIGLETATRVEILSGLNQGELVVVGGRSSLQPGQAVLPKLTALGAGKA